jgi:tetratricopeptide (TPR) repeat protein
MSSTTVTCPQCQTILRATKPIGAGQALRCASCSHRFRAPGNTAITTSPSAPPDQAFPTAAPPSRSLTPIIAAVCITFFVMGGGIAGAIWLMHRPSEAPTTQVDPAKQKLADDEKRLSDREKELAEKEAKLELANRKVEFGRLLTVADAALEKKHYPEAEKLYTEALKLVPGDSQALAGLVRAKTGAELATQAGEDKEKRQTEYKRLMTLGKDKMLTKEYAAAVNAFKAALELMPADSTAIQARLDAETALAKDQTEKDKLEKYKKFMEAGRLAMLAQRYPDAVREYVAALQQIPGDPAALKGQRDAERQVNALANGDKQKQFIQDELGKGRAALEGKRYREAIRILEDLLNTAPEEAEATRLLQTARQSYARLRDDFNRVLLRGNVALQARRYEEAITHYQEAVRILPDEETGTKALQQAQKALQDYQVSQVAYDRFMREGTQAMINKQYLTALNAFNEALRIAPADANANAGMLDARKALNRELDRKKDYDRLTKVIKNAMLQQNWPTAIQAINDALRLNPDDLDLPVLLIKARYNKAMADGQSAYGMMRYSDAVRFFQDALSLKPGDPAANALLAQARVKVK